MAKAIAKLSFLQMAPRKVRLVAGSIRGLSAHEAEAQLMLRVRRASEPLLKLLRSAVANAKVLKMNPDRLVVGKITVDQGPMLKRFLPRAQGRATPLQKKMSHVVLVLEEGVKSVAPRFTIVKPEKKKAHDHKKEGKSKQPKTSKPELNLAPKEKKESFFKRVFRRKSV